MNRSGRLRGLQKVLQRIALPACSAVLLFGVLNTLVACRRVVILHREQNTPEEKGAEKAAAWLTAANRGSRILLYSSGWDNYAVWFGYRLNYLTYPLAHDTVWDSLPSDSSRRYDLLLATGFARRQVGGHWRRIRGVSYVSLYGSSRAPFIGFAPAAQSGPMWSNSAARVLRAALALSASALLGWCAIVLMFPAAPFQCRAANLALAHLTGAAVLTWATMLGALITGRWTTWPAWIALVALLCWAMLIRQSLSFQNREPDTAPRGGAATASPGFPRWLTILSLVGIAVGVAATLERGWLLGIGWDGYSIWQLKAKALTVDGSLDILHQSGRFAYAHLDYPLLVPAQTWWLSVSAGVYSQRWAQLAGIAFALDIAAILHATLRRMCGWEVALLGVALLATLPQLTAHATSGFADIEMAAYFLLLAVSLLELQATPDRSSFILLVLSLAGIVLVKNEGLLAAASAILAVLALRRLAMAAAALAAAAIAYAPWLWIKLSLGLKNDVLQPAGGRRLTARILAWRIGYALAGMLLEIVRTGPRAGGWGLIAVLFLLGAAACVAGHNRSAGPIWLLCCLQLCGYYLIYLITPHPLGGHMASSVDRLWLHVIPALTLAALLCLFCTDARESEGLSQAGLEPIGAEI